MNKSKVFSLIILVFGIWFSSELPVRADDQEIAKKLANPIAALISVPFQYNFDDNYGPADDGLKNFVNIQPVIPFSISEDWNVISRTILPVISQENIPPGSSKSGLGDTTQSFFFSPKEPTSGGLIWGVGPAILLPTATDETLGGERWAAGPTFVGLKQEGPWTLGFLTNQLWSFAGDEERSDINSTYLQPFISYVTKTHTTFSINTESTYNWTEEQWNLPVNLIVAQLFKIGNQPMQFGVGPRYWVESADAGAEGWGLRAQLTLIFPK